MNKKRVVRCCFAVVLCVMCGCETVIVPPKAKNDTRQGDPSEPYFGNPGEVTMYNLESAARRLMADMKMNAEFNRYYAAKKAEKNNARPTVIVGDIKNETTQHIFHRLVTIRDTIVRPELLNSGIFTILSEDAESPADYAVYGSFRMKPDSGGRYSYYLVIGIKDVESGVIIWEGLCKNVNSGPAI